MVIKLPWVFLLFLCLPSMVWSEQPEAWTQWRGPTRDGILRNAAPWPAELTEANCKKIWSSADLGPSYSGPLIAGDRVFTTATVKGATEVVTAHDRTTGKELWKAEWPGAMAVPFFAMSNGSWIRATPAYDGELLYVAGMRDVLVCLEAATGKERWRVDFVKELKSPLPSFGFVSSPLVAGNHVYVQAGAGLIKLEKATGKIVWRVLDDGGGMYGSAFSSPVLKTFSGRQQLLVQTRMKLAGVDPDSGKVFWSAPVEAERGMNIVTPTSYGEDSLLTSAYGGRTELRKILPESTEFNVKVAWSEKSQGYMSSPLIIGKHAYMHLKNQRFCCVDLEAGKTVWTTKPYGKYWSMVANGEQILALDEDGELYLIKANPEKFELVSQLRVSRDPCWAHLATVGNEFVIREQNALTLWKWEDPAK